ncbi:MAG: uroporphyrinogen decarboxylase family protein [Limisphaerales bacterium]
MSLFVSALHRDNHLRPPVWFMRQAGRYHRHYQDLRRTRSFVELCKRPELACETALGPVHEFGFDAAILFSDLLFPLESLGMPLEYNPGPTLGWHLRSSADLARLSSGPNLSESLRFQADAVRLLRKALPGSKGVLGFVGGPLTLFVYAVEGSHVGDLSSMIEGLSDGRFQGFLDHLIPLLARNMADQYRAGASTIAVLDTSAGSLPPGLFQTHVVPALERLFRAFHEYCPCAPITYYSKQTGPEHWNTLRGLPISCLGIDWNHPIDRVLLDLSDRWAIQGNIDPHWLLQSPDALEAQLRPVFDSVRRLPAHCRRAWVCGLGHGVLPGTPEAGVHRFIRLQHETFGETL